MKNSIKYTAILLPAVIVIAFMALWLTGALGIWTIGIPYIAANTNVFTDENSRSLPGEYSVNIRISPENAYRINRGIELYNDGSNKIYVYAVYIGGNENGFYSIQFISVGKYSSDGASLVSGARHSVNADGSDMPRITAKMTAEYNGKTYNCIPNGAERLVYNGKFIRTKNMDHFTFFIFPQEAVDNREVEWESRGMVKLTVTGLYENIWTMKQP